MASFIKESKVSLNQELSSLSKQIQSERQSRVANTETDAEFFCSQSVATILKAMGILPSSIPTTEYLPYSFSSTIGLPLLKGASLSKEMYIRGNNEIITSLQIEPSKEPVRNEVPHAVTELTTEEERHFIETQMHLARSFGRCSQDTLHNLLQEMKLSNFSLHLTHSHYFLPGDVFPLSDTQFALCVLLHGSLTFNRFNETHGETVIEARTPLSLLGVTCHPSDAYQFPRFGEESVAVVGSLDADKTDHKMKEAHGLHRGERLNVIRGMQKYPLFQHLTKWEQFLLSYFFYKVELAEGDLIGKEGVSPGYACYVYRGCVERKARENQHCMKNGSFLGLDEIMTNSASPCDYVVKSPTTVFVLHPAVLEYFVGGRFASFGQVLRMYRAPATEDLQQIERVVNGLRALDIKDGVRRMREGYAWLRREGVEMAEETVVKKEAFVQLLRRVFDDDGTTERAEGHRQKEDAVAAGIDASQQMGLIESINWFVAFLFGGSNQASSVIEEKNVEATSDLNKLNTLSDFTDEQIAAVLQALQFDNPVKAAKWLLYLKLCGCSELCEMTKEAARDAVSKESVEFLFGGSQSLSFESFSDRIASSSLPGELHDLLQSFESAVSFFNPSPSEHHLQAREVIDQHRRDDQGITMHTYSPFNLLPYPCPFPYVFTFATTRESITANYWSYVIAGFFGELFVLLPVPCHL